MSNYYMSIIMGITLKLTKSNSFPTKGNYMKFNYINVY